MSFNRPKYLTDQQSAEMREKMKSGTFNNQDIHKLLFGKSVKKVSKNKSSVKPSKKVKKK
jgi:hypothetical protein